MDVSVVLSKGFLKTWYEIFTLQFVNSHNVQTVVVSTHCAENLTG